MCGIVYFFNKLDTLKRKRQAIEKLLEAANNRGGHSFGFVLFDKEGKPTYEKRANGRGVTWENVMSRAHGILYHARFGTSAPIMPHFAQPFRTAVGYSAHNGHVSDPAVLSYDSPYYELDSAHLLTALADRSPEVSKMYGYGAVVEADDRGIVSAWADHNQIYTASGKSFLAVSSVPVPVGVKWIPHIEQGAFLTASVKAPQNGFGVEPDAIRLASRMRDYKRFRAKTNHGTTILDDSDDYDVSRFWEKWGVE